MEDQLLRTAEVADILSLSRSKVYIMLKRGMIPIVQIGSMVRVRRSDLDKFIQDMEKNNRNTLPKA
jgi:excisionase family DNA binding protein